MDNFIYIYLQFFRILSLTVTPSQKNGQKLKESYIESGRGIKILRLKEEDFLSDL